MRKAFIFLILLFMTTQTAFAVYDDGHTDKGVVAREWEVISRGVMNIVGFPFEFPRTISSEAEIHKWVWPVTSLPRIVTNMIIRFSSAANDILLYPWAVPFTNDISPWTDHFGLPEYPWNME